MLNNEKIPLHLLKDIKGQYLEAFLIAYEGWRRGLKLTWYNENESDSVFGSMNGVTGKLFSLESKRNKHYFFRTRGDKVSNVGVKIAKNKDETKEILQNNSVSVPEGKQFKTINKNQILNYAKTIGFPVVLKPLDSYMGKGVFCDIESEEELLNVYNYFISDYQFKNCIIEKQYHGEEHRIYVVGDEAVSCINRKKAFVICDGKHNIRELIDIKNLERNKNPYLRDKPIKIDRELKLNLSKEKLNIDEVYEKNKYIKLRNLSNLSRGGEPHEVSSSISKEIKELAVKALKSLPNVSHGAVDIIISPEDDSQGKVIEINTSPEIVFHFYPLSGESVPIPSKIIDHYFPETKNILKSNFYFDYLEILKILETGLVRELNIKNLESGEILETQVVLITSKVTATNMNYIRNFSIKNDFSGTIQKLNDKSINLVLLHTESQSIDNMLSKIQNKIKAELEIIRYSESNEQFRLGGFYRVKKEQR